MREQNLLIKNRYISLYIKEKKEENKLKSFPKRAKLIKTEKSLSNIKRIQNSSTFIIHKVQHKVVEVQPFSITYVIMMHMYFY